MKIKYRSPRWVEPDVENSKVGHVKKRPLTCADLTTYIENFIRTFAPEYVAEGKMYEGN